MNIQWDKTQKTWHVDINGVGRYSVRRTSSANRAPFAAYLNGERIMSESVHSNADIVKRAVETRIEKALDIAKAQSPDEQRKLGEQRRAEIIAAAMKGVREFASSTRGGAQLGASSTITETQKGFVVVFGNDNRIYFDVMEM